MPRESWDTWDVFNRRGLSTAEAIILGDLGLITAAQLLPFSDTLLAIASEVAPMVCSAVRPKLRHSSHIIAALGARLTNAQKNMVRVLGLNFGIVLMKPKKERGLLQPSSLPFSSCVCD